MPGCLSLLLALLAGLVPSISQEASKAKPQISLVWYGPMGPAAGLAAEHGRQKLKDALGATGISVEEVPDAAAAHGGTVIEAGLAGAMREELTRLGLKAPEKPESLLIHWSTGKGKPTLLVAGSDDRGLMYGLLEVAERIGWARDKTKPLSEIRDTAESASVADRDLILFTMQKHQYEDRLHDEHYWVEYLDMLAADRFNSLELLFGYETGGYNCPVYPYYIGVDGFPEVRVTGLSDEERESNRADLHRLVRMAHERGIRVTFGIWCHYARYTQDFHLIDHTKPVPDTVSGLTEANLVPYTRAAIGQFLREFHEIDGVQLLMMNESGLKTEEMKAFWHSIYQTLKDASPDMQYELRAKGISDDLIQDGIDMGLKIRVNTKYWSEQVGLPFHPTHVQSLNQFDRRHGYSDMLKYPRNYKLHWTLWTSGTTRVLLWGDPEYVRRFAATTHLGGVDGFDVMEPLATKMEGQPHDAKPFELLSPAYRSYEYEFQRYWYFFSVFGRLTFNPDTPRSEWDHAFAAHYGPEAAPWVRQGLERASQILPQITAYNLPADHFPTTRGWPERQRQGDLGQYVEAEPSDTEQYESLKDAADDIVEGRSSPKRTPQQTSRWFSAAAADVRRLAAEAERQGGSNAGPSAGPNAGKELASTVIDLKILAGLAEYHSRRVLAGLSYALYEKTQALDALDDAIQHEREAVDAWAGIVRDAGDAYNFDLRMGLPSADLSGHWRDELVKLKQGLAALEEQHSGYRLEARRVVGRYQLGSGALLPGYERVQRGPGTLNEGLPGNVIAIAAPDGRYEVTVGIEDDKTSHGPMWMEVNGAESTGVFSVPAGQPMQRSLETPAVDGKIKVLFDNATSADWRADTLTVTRVDPAVAHVPVRRLMPGEDLRLRVTVAGVAPMAHVLVYYGDAQRCYRSAELHSDGAVYSGAIAARELTGGTSYFLQAEDSSGRIAVFPKDGRAHPIQVLVSADREPPALRHTPVIEVRPGHSLRISAQVTDPSGVAWVRLLYRGLSQHQDYQVLTMLPTGKPNEYEATVPGAAIDSQFDFMYLFEVMDKAGNGRIYPEMEKETPYYVVPLDRPER